MREMEDLRVLSPTMQPREDHDLRYIKRDIHGKLR